MKNKNLIIALSILLVIASCSKADDQNNLPTALSYGGEIIATFFTEGNSYLPEVDWNGNKGRFGLETAIDGISIDSKTGVISWDDKLPIGVTKVSVVAFNNSGSSKQTVNLNNRLSGSFKGEHNPAIYLVFNTDFIIQFDFEPDGIFTGYTQSKYPDCTLSIGDFEGQYKVVNGQIQGQFKYSPSSNTTNYLFGEIRYTSNGAKFEGWHDVQPEKDDYFSEFNTAFVPAN